MLPVAAGQALQDAAGPNGPVDVLPAVPLPALPALPAEPAALVLPSPEFCPALLLALPPFDVEPPALLLVDPARLELEPPLAAVLELPEPALVTALPAEPPPAPLLVNCPSEPELLPHATTKSGNVRNAA